MAVNSVIRKNHLEQSLRTSRAEVLALNEAAAEDIEALNTNFAALLAFLTKAGLNVDADRNIYQLKP